MGQASSFYQMEYVIYFYTDNPNYPNSPYRLGAYSSRDEADRVCNEYKSGTRQLSISGKGDHTTLTEKITGTYTIKKEHIV